MTEDECFKLMHPDAPYELRDAETVELEKKLNEAMHEINEVRAELGIEQGGTSKIPTAPTHVKVLKLKIENCQKTLTSLEEIAKMMASLLSDEYQSKQNEPLAGYQENRLYTLSEYKNYLDRKGSH